MVDEYSEVALEEIKHIHQFCELNGSGDDIFKKAKVLFPEETERIFAAMDKIDVAVRAARCEYKPVQTIFDATNSYLLAWLKIIRLVRGWQDEGL